LYGIWRRSAAGLGRNELPKTRGRPAELGFISQLQSAQRLLPVKAIGPKPHRNQPPVKFRGVRPPPPTRPALMSDELLASQRCQPFFDVAHASHRRSPLYVSD